VGESIPKAEAAAACWRPIPGYIAAALVADVLADMGGDSDMERSTATSSRLMPANAAAKSKKKLNYKLVDCLQRLK